MAAKRTPTKISNRNTELITLSSYDLNNVHFDNPNEMSIEQGNKTIKYYKINVGSKNKNGVGEFIFDLPFFCHSFGIDEFQNDQGKVTSHSVSLSMVDNQNPTEEQLELVASFGKFIEKIKDHLLAVKKEIKKPTLDRAELKTFNPMHQALDEDGNPKGNTWYFSPKLLERKIYNKEDPNDIQIKMETQFFLDDQFDAKGDPVEISPLEFVGKKHFKFRGAIKVENIYIGSKISLQCKIYDGVVRTVSNERKRMTVVKPGAAASAHAALLNGDDEDDDTEIVLEDD